MKIVTVGLLMCSAFATPRISNVNEAVPAASSIQVIDAKVSSPMSQWQNYQSRMNLATDELETILNDAQQMSPEALDDLEMVLEDLVERQNELVQIVSLSGQGLQQGLITSESDIKKLNEVVEPEISAFEDAVFRLRHALDIRLGKQVEI